MFLVSGWRRIAARLITTNWFPVEGHAPPVRERLAIGREKPPHFSREGLRAWKRSKFSEEQIAHALRQTESGTPRSATSAGS